MKCSATSMSKKVARNMFVRNCWPSVRKKSRHCGGNAVPRHVTFALVLMPFSALGPQGHVPWSTEVGTRLLKGPSTRDLLSWRANTCGVTLRA